MTITLRNTNATGATNKGSTLTYNELDANFVDLLTNKLANISEDTTPQLGGALDAQSNNFTNVGTLNSHTIPGGTGTIALTSDITGISNIVEDTTPQLGGNLESNGNEIHMDETTGIIKFNNTDLRISAGTSTNTILSSQALLFQQNASSTFTVADNSGNKLFKIDPASATELYHTTNKKLETASGGVTITGTLNGHTIPGGTGTIALTSDISDSNTTYAISAETTTGGANLRLTDSSAGTDDVKIAQGTGITVTRTDANTITLASTVTAGISNLVEDTTPQLGGALDAQTNNFTNVGTINTHTIPGGTGTIALTSDIIDTQIVGGTDITVTQPDSGGSFVVSFSGSAGIASLANDTTPQLGGSLDVNGNAIVSTANANININPDGSGKVQINNTYTLPNADGTNGQVLTTDGAGTLSFTTVSGGSSTLDGLSDVSASGPTNNQIIKYNSGASQWQLGTALSNVSEDTSPQLGGTLDCQDNIVQSPQLKDYTETVYTSGTATGTITPDVANGNVQMITLTGDITLNALSNVSNGQSMTLIVRQPSSGGPYTLTSTMKFAGGTKTLTTTANAYDIISIFYQDSTHGYFASLSTNFS